MASRFSEILPPKGGSHKRPYMSVPVASAFRRKILAFGAVLTIGAAVLAQTPTPEDQAKRAAERLAALQRESEALAKQERTLLAELRKLEIEREIRVEELTKVQREIGDVQKQLAATTTRAQQLQGQVEKQR